LCQGYPEARVGKVNAAVRSADHIVRAVETFALKPIHQHIEASIGMHTRDAAIAALAHDDAPLQIKRRAIAFARIFPRHLGLFTRRHAVQPVATQIDEIVTTPDVRLSVC
jgi:hypothetical protein